MQRSSTLIATALSLGLLGLAGCRTNDDPMAETGETSETSETGAEGGTPCEPADDAVDESSCAGKPSDYLPTDSDNDDYPACISDGGNYELVDAPPGSIARIETYDMIAELLWRNGAPTPDDFTAARTAYDIDEGLGSRVSRREDLHYPPIPEADWDPGLDPDKQCSNSDLAIKYPDRCAGPAKLEPIINAAFIAGMSGDGDPNIHAARIEAVLVWFSYLAVYKEAYTCIDTPKDCDSSWAYYAGGAQVDGDVIGFAQLVDTYSPNAHQRIFDGILAVRCWRDLYPGDMYPTWADLPTEGQDMFDTAWAQLDDALARGLAVAQRQHILAHDDAQCSEALAANWAFVQVVGQGLDREVRERDAAAADELMDIYALDAPTSDDLTRAAELIDTAIPCP